MLSELPVLDPESFEDICHNLLFLESEIKSISLDNLMKLMMDHSNNKIQHQDTREEMQRYILHILLELKHYSERQHHQ